MHAWPQAQLAARKLFGAPKLGLDAVGGEAGLRLAEALERGGQLVCYGALAGRPAVWPWQALVFRELSVRGCNLRAQLTADTPAGAARMRAQLAAVGKLVRAGLLELETAEYEFAAEFSDALDHALDNTPGGARVLLRFGGGGGVNEC